ncbi:hypothetical protein [Paramicrobacterium agarici]|uniref:hypothetical protein n=1 Tax=Paramicrobacterium agarici TaxID=630514 RepID=UPI00114DC15D|nr:hypothetical protein [Microbacterium agarici]TQO21473.1 hypothetical protein FB385_0276 [Microbacterium agarici]
MSPLLHPPGLGRGGTLGAGATPAGEMQLRWPGLDPLDPTLDVLVFDDSGSLTGAAGNDPVGNRYAEARRAVELLSQWTMTSRQKLAVLHFDYPHVDSDGPHRLDQAKSRNQALRALAVPSGVYGSSALAPAMMAANRIARDHGEITRCTIFSDFELADPNPAQPYDEIAAFPGLVHAIVLNADPPTALTAVPNVTVTRLASDSPPGLAAAALMQSLATGRRGARRPALRIRR